MEKTKSLINIFFLILLISIIASCSKNGQEAVIGTIYKKDISINHDGKEFIGMAVLPELKSYDIHIKAKGDLDLFAFTNCHREETSERAWNVKEVKKTFFFKRTTDKKNEIQLNFKPTEFEKDGPCPVFISAFEKDGGRHSWGYIDFENEENKLLGQVQCNGETNVYSGVSVCQTRSGLTQKISFSVPVKTSPDCPIRPLNSNEFEIEVQKNECVFVFMSDSGATHKLVTFGYEQILIREN